jgi:hypothetical protein
MATYTASQLQAGALNTDRFDGNAEETNTIKMSIKLNVIPPAERSIADVGQCALIIETLNLGTNPTVRDRDIQPPFGKNPTVNYMDAGYTGAGVIKTNIVADTNAYGFFPQRPTGEEFIQSITFSSLGINHNLSTVQGSVAGLDPEGSNPFERFYLPQRNEGRKIAVFTFNNNNTNTEAGIMKAFFWRPSGVLTEYGGEGGEEEFYYGSVRFKGIGNFDLTTAAVNLLAG